MNNSIKKYDMREKAVTNFLYIYLVHSLFLSCLHFVFRLNFIFTGFLISSSLHFEYFSILYKYAFIFSSHIRSFV